MDIRGCLLLIIFGILAPFIPGIIGCFCLGGGLWGIGAIFYTIMVFGICSQVEEDRKGKVYFLLMIPFYIVEIYGVLKGLREGNL